MVELLDEQPFDEQREQRLIPFARQVQPCEAVKAHLVLRGRRRKARPRPKWSSLSIDVAIVKTPLNATHVELREGLAQA